MNKIRVKQEKTDATQAFTLYHSIGGGTGSGFGTLILLKIRDAFPDKITCSYSIFPSPKVSDTVVEPYNAVLSIHQLLDLASQTYVIDNEALYNIAHNVLKQNSPKLDDLNRVINQTLMGVTAPFRFQGVATDDLRKQYNSLVPFPRLSLLHLAQAPIIAEGSTPARGSAQLFDQVKSA